MGIKSSLASVIGLTLIMISLIYNLPSLYFVLKVLGSLIVISIILILVFIIFLNITNFKKDKSEDIDDERLKEEIKDEESLRDEDDEYEDGEKMWGDDI